MMPSRGFMRGNAPRIFQLQCRNLSSASRQIPQPHLFTSSPTRSTQWRTNAPLLITSIVASRNASTTTTPASQPPAATPAPAPSEPPYPNMDTITLDNIDLTHPEIPTHIAVLPEKIGYLHEIGLNYGWGPTSTVQWIIEHMHIYTGLPWWGSICATAILVRVALLPFFIKSSDVTAKQSALTPLTAPLMQKMQAAQKAGDATQAALAWKEVSAVRKRAGVSFRAQFTPMIVQAMLGYGGFRVLRGAADLPVPAFITEGPLWLSDLTVPDPFLILPIAMAGTVHLMIRMGGETGATALTGGMRTFMLYVMPAIILVSTGFLPAAVTMWFAAGSALGILQGQLLMRPWVREKLGIAPIYKPTPEESKGHPWSRIRSSSNTTSSYPESPVGRGRYAASASTEPIYQAPNLRTSSSSGSYRSSNVIDVRGTSRMQQSQYNSSSVKPDFPQPTPTVEDQKSTLTTRFREGYKGFRNQINERTGNTPEGRAKREKDAVRKAAEAYEKRAKEMERRRRGGQ